MVFVYIFTCYDACISDVVVDYTKKKSDVVVASIQVLQVATSFDAHMH